ncbi:zinc ABC transporter substrate-binding protein [Selenomonadales bacterium OttesenSCG-928-I06]|nr:zinc ABC transporter substrate-binding protein [Selenomonadales bacterium OttesenSCG-928-I06]
MNFLKIIALVLTMIFTLTGCSSQQTLKTENSGKIKVIASVYPVYEFTKQVGKDKIDLSMLSPVGGDPHDFEPTPKEIIKLKSADIFIYHGADLEPWVENLINKNTLQDVTIVEASKNVKLLEFFGDHHNHNHNNNTDEHDVDPHVWLDPERAIIEVNNIAEALAQKDPKNAEYYKENAKEYNLKLAKLDEEFSANKEYFQGKKLVTNHAAFGYLADKYGFEQIAVMGLMHDAQSTPERIAIVSNLCKQHEIKYIFTETVVNTKLTEAIAKEVGAEILVLNPLDSLTKEEYEQNKDYLSIMQENLNNLKKAFVK